MPQEDIGIQTLQAVPAESVSAVFTQHLSTALVPLDVDATQGALLDGHVGVAVGERPVFMSWRGENNGLVLGAGVAILPGPPAAGAEDGMARRAGHGGRSALHGWLHVTHGLTFNHWTPGFTGVQLDTSLKLEALVQLHLIC